MTVEQKAEEIANKRCHEIMCFGHCNFSSPKHHRCGNWHREYNCALDGYHEGFKDCAKSRLNVTTISDCPIKDEWHYVSKKDYPKEYEDLWICFITDEDSKDYVRGWAEYDFDNDKWVFKYLDVLGTQYLKNIYAWQTLVPPKEIE